MIQKGLTKLSSFLSATWALQLWNYLLFHFLPSRQLLTCLEGKRLNRTNWSSISVLEINPALKLLKATEESSRSSQYKHMLVAGRGLTWHTPTPVSLFLPQKHSLASQVTPVCPASVPRLNPRVQQSTVAITGAIMNRTRLL